MLSGKTLKAVTRMEKKLKVQRAVLMLITLLCGVCAGMLIPSENRAQPSVAAFSQSVDAPAASEAQKEIDVNAADGVAETTPAAPDAANQPAGTPAAVQENLFAVGGTATQAPTQAPAEPAGGFGIEVIKRQPHTLGKRVLIYHTHTYEAYEKADGDPYQETEQWRTADEGYNVVRVGEELAGLLRGLGVEVVHDTTAFEPPNLSSAYTRSLEMLRQRRAAGESFDLYIDLHRDAYVASQTGANTVNVGGAELARMMLLIGKGEGQTTQGFDERPDWEANLAIAQAITDAVNAQAQGLCKDVRMKSGRFNQHIAVGCVLVEAGNNRNTLAQALAAMPYLADAIVETLR